MSRRRVEHAALEQRLREQLPPSPELSEVVRESIRRRVRAGVPMAAGRAHRSWTWALPAGVAVAGAITAVALLRPGGAPGPTGEDPAVLARAMGRAVHDSLGERPRGVALMVEEVDDALAAEAWHLLADARHLAERLAAPVRTVARGGL